MGGGGRRGGCTQFVHGLSGMTIDPRIPTMPGRSTSGFRQPGRHGLHQARRAVGFFGESHARVNCILPTTARKTDFGTLCLLARLWVTATNELRCFLVWPLGGGGGG